MKIVISPTRTDITGRSADATNHAVTIEHPSDDLNVVEVMRLISNALIAYGFHPKSVSSCLEESLSSEIFSIDDKD